MDTQIKSVEKFNELIFENRNKEYGAYVLRKSYNSTVGNSLVITCISFGILILLVISFTNNKVEMPDISIVNDVPILTKTVEVILPEREKIKPPVEPKREIAPKTDNGQLKVEDDKTKGVDKTNDQLNISKNANPNGKADSAAHQKNGIGKIDLPTPPIEKIVDQMPELENMNRFISENLQYPRGAIENGTSGTVYVTFVVELDGSISNVEVLRGIGDGCEQEALRVVKMMPNWKPGINHGKLVRVQCNLPVKFRLK